MTKILPIQTDTWLLGDNKQNAHAAVRLANMGKVSVLWRISADNNDWRGYQQDENRQSAPTLNYPGEYGIIIENDVKLLIRTPTVRNEI